MKPIVFVSNAVVSFILGQSVYISSQGRRQKKFQGGLTEK